jgi:hypothetical protein
MARHEDINSCLLCVGRSSLVIAQERLELIGAQLLSVEEGSAEAGGLAAEQMQLEAEVQEQERQKAAQLAENVRRRRKCLNDAYIYCLSIFQSLGLSVELMSLYQH